MITFTKNWSTSNALFLLPLLVIISSVILAGSSLMVKYPNLAIGITYDLVLTAPLAYFFIIRKRKISKLTTIPVFVIGIILASLLIPETQQDHLAMIKTYALPVIELGVLSFLTLKTYKVVKAYKRISGQTADFYAALKKSTAETFGTGFFSKVLSSEIALFYYSFFAWKRPIDSENTYTNYKDNGLITLLWAAIFLLAVETVVIHLLLEQWSGLAAWILSGSSIYTVLMIFGHIKVLNLRPSLLTSESLVLRNGLISEISIPLANIEKAELFSEEIGKEDSETGNNGLFKESKNHNIVLYLKAPQVIEKAYGIKQYCERLVFYIDDKHAFIEKINMAMEK